MTAVHRESHGMIPNEIIPVVESDVLRFLGTITDPANASESTSAFRTVLFTDLEGSTSLLHELGQSAYLTLLAEHDLIIRRALVASRGREVKHTGDGIMAAFDDVPPALSGGSAILDGFDERNVISPAPALRVRIGIAAGEPVDRNDDLFGSTVNLASRICQAADPGQILVSDVVHDLGHEGRVPVPGGRALVMHEGLSGPDARLRARPWRRSRLLVGPESRVDDAIDRHASVMDVPRAEHALALEPGTLDHPLRRLVADHDEAVDPDDRCGGERPIGEASERPRTDATTAGTRVRATGRQSPDAPQGRIESPRPRIVPVPASTIANGAPVPSRHIVSLLVDERIGIGGQEWLRDRHPARDLGVLADLEDGRGVGRSPGPQHELVHGERGFGLRFAPHGEASWSATASSTIRGDWHRRAADQRPEPLGVGQRQPERIHVELTVESIEAEEQRADDRLELGLDERGFRQGGDDLVTEERGSGAGRRRPRERAGRSRPSRPTRPAATRAYSPRTRPLRTTMSARHLVARLGCVEQHRRQSGEQRSRRASACRS